MIKVVFLMRRKPGMAFETFSDYWLNSHVKLIRQYAGPLKILKYVQSHALPSDVMQTFRPEWDDTNAWDGIAEVWLESLDVLRQSRGTTEMDRIQDILLADEASFVDLERSTVIVTQEHEIL